MTTDGQDTDRPWLQTERLEVVEPLSENARLLIQSRMASGGYKTLITTHAGNKAAVTVTRGFKHPRIRIATALLAAVSGLGLFPALTYASELSRAAAGVLLFGECFAVLASAALFILFFEVPAFAATFVRQGEAPEWFATRRDDNVSEYEKVCRMLARATGMPVTDNADKQRM